VDLAATRLRRNGVTLELRPRAFRVLKVLLQNPGRLVDYQQMIREAWDGVQVSTHTVTVTVCELKEALGEYGSWITCRPKLGYRLEIPSSEDLLRTGWHFSNQYTCSGMEEALRCFQQAAHNDGADFRAFEAISNTRLMMGSFLYGSPRENYRGFLEAHQRAVALCGLTPDLRLDRAYALYIFEQKLGEAEAELIEAHREGARAAEFYVRLSVVRLALGRLDQAVADLEQAQASDPLFPPLSFVWTILRLFRREFEQAVACAENTLKLHPGSQIGRADYAAALEFAGRPEEALVQYRLASGISPNVTWIQAREALCLARHGRHAEARPILETLERNRDTVYVDAYHVALLSYALGRRDDAFRDLARARAENSWAAVLIDVDPRADELRTDPCFAHFHRSAAAGAAPIITRPE
jgi:DNA-binding winged helix-turn-helix (wHTH) protein